MNTKHLCTQSTMAKQDNITSFTRTCRVQSRIRNPPLPYIELWKQFSKLIIASAGKLKERIGSVLGNFSGVVKRTAQKRVDSARSEVVGSDIVTVDVVNRVVCVLEVVPQMVHATGPGGIAASGFQGQVTLLTCESRLVTECTTVAGLEQGVTPDDEHVGLGSIIRGLVRSVCWVSCRPSVRVWPCLQTTSALVIGLEGIVTCIYDHDIQILTFACQLS